jgi:NAD(P)-dependent dehydrogenase (short-subunit alcohol dehydrogenase family)
MKPAPAKTAIVTGAGRGIGRALVAEFRSRGWRPVIAAYHDLTHADGLLVAAAADPGVVPVELDVTSDASTARFAQVCQSYLKGLDILVNNAGIPATPSSILDAPISALVAHAQTHAIGAVRVTQAVLDLLGEGSVVANISSVLGSMGGIGSHYTHYAPAKAFQNALTLQLAAGLRPRRVAVLAIHPGWVATRIGGTGAPLTPTASARAVYDIVARATMADTATFVDYTGRVLPW